MVQPEGAEASTEAFGALVRSYVGVLDGDVRGLGLLRDLRTALTDLYAAAIHVSPAPPRSGDGSIHLLEDSRRVEIEASLQRRLPPEMYWSALLPLTYKTVGNAGVKQLAEDLVEVCGWLAPGLRLLETASPTSQLEDWWFGTWDVSWGITSIRCISILHEVINDLENGA